MSKMSSRPGASVMDRILVLVPGDPSSDPRIGWVTDLCAEFARTDVIGIVAETDRPLREYDGRTYIERAFIGYAASAWARTLARLGGAFRQLGCTARYIERKSREVESGAVSYPPTAAAKGPAVSWQTELDHCIGGVCRFLGMNLSLRHLISGICRRARAVSVVPRLVICHDLHALVAGIQLKKLFGCAVIYDSHECWPEADLLSAPWEMRYWARFERPFIRQADAVITVTPQIAQYLSELYDIHNVVVVPNACPRTALDRPACRRVPDLPVKFLFQGGAAVGRGLDLLLAAWDRFADARTILYVRCPENELLAGLRRRYAASVERGTVVFMPPVKEEDLVTAATFADVGVIPYAPASRNHAYCCPNKLSQYMQAGLAMLVSDTAFVGERVREFDCGLVFKANDADGLIEHVKRLREEPRLLQRLKANAFHHSQATYHWQQVATPYREAIARLLHSDAISTHAAGRPDGRRQGHLVAA